MNTLMLHALNTTNVTKSVNLSTSRVVNGNFVIEVVLPWLGFSIFNKMDIPQGDLLLILRFKI